MPVRKLERTNMPGVRMDGWPHGGETPHSCCTEQPLSRLLTKAVGRRDGRHSHSSALVGTQRKPSRFPLDSAQLCWQICIGSPAAGKLAHLLPAHCQRPASARSLSPV